MSSFAAKLVQCVKDVPSQELDAQDAKAPAKAKKKEKNAGMALLGLSTMALILVQPLHVCFAGLQRKQTMPACQINICEQSGVEGSAHSKPQIRQDTKD